MESTQVGAHSSRSTRLQRLALHLEIGTYAMNRQVGPSILFSVLIVCFFAVALFQRDPPRTAHDKARLGPGDAIAGSTPALRPYALDRFSSQTQTSEPKEASPAQVVVQSQSAAQSPASSLARGKPDVDRSIRAPAESSTEPDGPKPADHIGAARAPRAAFTVVSAAETIQDVALRVYGSTDGVDSLWRANRDALPRRDSPLSTGMVLRTPTLR
jgi:hypothetical protein